MKWALAQLRKMKCPFNFEGEIDLSDDLNGFEDILKVGTCKVSGVCNYIAHDEYLFHLEITVVLTLECAVTLKEIEREISVQASELFSKKTSDEDAYVIDGQTIDLHEAIVTNVILAKPMKAVLEGHENDFESINELTEELVNPALADLKDLLK